MTRRLITLLGTAAMLAASPALAQMHEGNRGGSRPAGGAPHAAPGGGMPRGAPERAGPQGTGPAPERGAAAPQWRGDQRAGGVARGPEFHGRAFSALRPEERAHWATGEWRHVMHNGVFGWWWFLDDDWYFYNEPVYPYPTYIAPLLSVQETPDTPPPAPYWYYCANPQGYYPYVPACPIGWQTVPAVPDDAPPGAPPPP